MGGWDRRLFASDPIAPAEFEKRTARRFPGSLEYFARRASLRGRYEMPLVAGLFLAIHFVYVIRNLGSNGADTIFLNIRVSR